MEINGVNSLLHLSPLKTRFGGYLCKIFQLLDDGYEVRIRYSYLGHLLVVARGSTEVPELFLDRII